MGNCILKVLVIGGAGYIGSHTCLALHEQGFTPVAFDNLSNGKGEAVRWGPLVRGDMHDGAALAGAIQAHRPVGVFHCAASIEIAASTQNPLAFHWNNVGGTLSLLRAMQATGLNRLVFSSSCSVYGEPLTVPIQEDHPCNPINPYGRSKWMVETVLDDLAHHDGLRFVTLRYFNAAGADPEGRIGEAHDPETHVVPIALEAASGERNAFRINGTDYDTPDGTCVRDYVHVADLADAHVRALRYLLGDGEPITLNVGTGRGTSIATLLEAVERVTGRTVPREIAPRREGDAATLVADSTRIRELLDWVPRHDLEDIVRTAWNWHRTRTRKVA